MDDEGVESTNEGAGEKTRTLLEELNQQFGTGETAQTATAGFSGYTQDVQRFGHIPDNPYAHAFELINSQPKDLEKDGYNILDDPQILLGNIEDPKTLRRYQMDLHFLTQLCGLAMIDPIFAHVFPPLWKSFKNEVRITSAMGGTERQYQAFHIPQQVKKKGFGFFRPKPKKREPIEYLLPQDEDEGMY